MTVDTWVQAGMAVVAAAGGVVSARSARRTKRQESRDDFLAVTQQQGKAIERLEARVERQESEAEKQRERIGDQDEAISWLLHRLRGLVSYVKKAGLEPPPADAMSERAARYLRNIDV
ncbi:hypothetical protein ACFWIO_19000 [Streptomyces diastatochromogenes]|uniref:hypothetical protein n=1 Tax=Streptomyces diastatochromogenes TaxID=42236 RepID=UPI0036641E98